LFTRNGRALTAKAVKPICPFQQVFQSTYLYGAFSPLDGSSFMLEMPHCNGANFQIFMDEFSKERPMELKVIVLDNGAFHKARTLAIPDNIILIFLPPYSPELNPAEKIWAKFKRDFTNRLFKTMDSLNDYVCGLAKELTTQEVRSITAFKYIFINNYWTIM
jgi:transposase